MKKIIAVHLLNDFSGSPFVFSQALLALSEQNYEVELYTATPSGNGFLSNLKKVKVHKLFYKWHKNKWITLFYFLWCQLRIFIKLLWRLRKNRIVYINSLLPFGAALAAKARGCMVVYHIHEVSIKPVYLKRFLLFVANYTATKGVFVSKDLKDRTAFNKPSSVIYNALPEEFVMKATHYEPRISKDSFNVLMLCSLKKYKGVLEFLACARKLNECNFKLVLNASMVEINAFFKDENLPPNLTLVSAQQNVHTFYSESDIVLNLSRPNEWIETFGMTLLEAMYYRKPTIVPKVGGVLELVTNGKEGYTINSNEVEAICKAILELKNNNELYETMSHNAFIKAQEFNSHKFKNEVLSLFKNNN